jgi:Aromatic-ring-opening dioxygenase LigAB, LigA subunit
VSVYAVNKLCRRVVHDPELRQALGDAPEEALRAARPPLSEEEVEALLAGDVGRLSKMGANHFLLHQLGRFQLLGLDLPEYAERIRAAYRT